jgi:hypothetical protein
MEKEVDKMRKSDAVFSEDESNAIRKGVVWILHHQEGSCDLSLKQWVSFLLKKEQDNSGIFLSFFPSFFKFLYSLFPC